MKAISVYDLKIIPELSNLTYFDMVDPAYDNLVLPFLEKMGFDTEYPLHYTVSQHRTLSNKVVVGFVIRGEVNTNRKHLTSEWSTVDDKLVAASYSDRSLCVEMAALMNHSLDYASLHSYKEGESAGEYSAVSPEETEITAQIKQLEELLFTVRGSQYKRDGSLKLASEYHTEEEIPKPRKKHVHKAKPNSRAKG